MLNSDRQLKSLQKLIEEVGQPDYEQAGRVLYSINHIIGMLLFHHTSVEGCIVDDEELCKDIKALVKFNAKFHLFEQGYSYGNPAWLSDEDVLKPYFDRLISYCFNEADHIVDDLLANIPKNRELIFEYLIFLRMNDAKYNAKYDAEGHAFFDDLRNFNLKVWRDLGNPLQTCSI